MPLATELGVAERVTEIPQRIDYQRALRSLINANALVLIGSDEPHYTASKLHPYLLAGRPLLAILHEKSDGCNAVRDIDGAELVTINEREDESECVRRIAHAMLNIARNPDVVPELESDALVPMSAAFMAQRYAALFDKLVATGCRRPWW
jgi:hypothetical protein